MPIIVLNARGGGERPENAGADGSGVDVDENGYVSYLVILTNHVRVGDVHHGCVRECVQGVRGCARGHGVLSGAAILPGP